MNAILFLPSQLMLSLLRHFVVLIAAHGCNFTTRAHRTQPAPNELAQA
jgi:hypothetical protein